MMVLKKCLIKAYPSIKLDNLSLKPPPNIDFGQLASSICFEIARRLNANPRRLAEQLVKSINKSDFCLGVPWWDYWVPLTSVLNGYPVKQLITPVAYHIEHPFRWENKYFKHFGARLVSYLLEPDISKIINDDFRTRIDFVKKHEDYIFLAMFIVNYIINRTEKIFYFPEAERPTKIEGSCKECRLMEMKLDYYKDRDLKIINFLEKKLMEMRKSLSWRITAPLRKIYGKIYK